MMNKKKRKSPPPRTKEQEEYRVSRLREAIAGRPMPEGQRGKISEASKRSWERGNRAMHSPESRKKVADKLRGRKRPPEVVAKINAANKGKKRTPEQIEEMRQRMKDAWAAGKGRPSPEADKRKRLALRAANLGKKQSPERIRRHAEALRGRKAAPEHVESRTAATRGRPQRAPVTAKGPSNKSSREGILRDPNGKTWPFRNLTHFVREHEHLFLEEDVEWRPSRPVKEGRLPLLVCRASKGLSNLYGQGDNVRGSWKGWTRADSQVDLRDDGADLVGRDGSRAGQEAVLTPGTYGRVRP
jgi:hypothetical protein